MEHLQRGKESARRREDVSSSPSTPCNHLLTSDATHSLLRPTVSTSHIANFQQLPTLRGTTPAAKPRNQPQTHTGSSGPSCSWRTRGTSCALAPPPPPLCAERLLLHAATAAESHVWLPHRTRQQPAASLALPNSYLTILTLLEVGLSLRLLTPKSSSLPNARFGICS
jgi:hypothetical protein